MYMLYGVLPPEFRVGSSPNELVTLWRGDKTGRLATGMTCIIEEGSDPETIVLNAALQGHDALNGLIDHHTSTSTRPGSGRNSPFVSVTPDVRVAQTWASRRGETIYKLKVPASRLVRDPDKIGSYGSLNEAELFVVGDVAPHQITAVKLNNDDPASSELQYERDGSPYRHDRYTLRSDPSPPVTTPHPNGIWQRS